MQGTEALELILGLEKRRGMFKRCIFVLKRDHLLLGFHLELCLN